MEELERLLAVETGGDELGAIEFLFSDFGIADLFFVGLIAGEDQRWKNVRTVRTCYIFP